MALFAKKINNTEMTDFISQQTEKHSIQTMCNALDISRSMYYKTFDQTVSKRDQENAQITKRRIEVHVDSKQLYGALKFTFYWIRKVTTSVLNVCIESFHDTLKKEEVNYVQYFDYKSAKIAVFQYIEDWYNRKESMAG